MAGFPASATIVPVADCDGVHQVDGLDDLPAPDGYAERLRHGREPTCLNSPR